ncbi:MAG: hypothetical protein EXR81_04000 [Gammaproteobacteria bacterium]|nr:hypothetical protein [Gammaproteobacteria bacterium]
MQTLIDELPFDKVISLYEERMRIEAMAKSRTKTKTTSRLILRRRTVLLRQHPELFDDEIMAEVKQTYERALKVIKKQK